MCRRHFPALRLSTPPSQSVCVRIVHPSSILGIPLVNLKFGGIIYCTPKCALMMQRNCWFFAVGGKMSFSWLNLYSFFCHEIKNTPNEATHIPCDTDS